MMTGLAFAIYEDYANKIFRGADLWFVRCLLKIGFGIDVHEANYTQENPDDEPIDIDGEEVPDPTIIQRSLLPTNVFNLRCFRNMLEGSEDTEYGWAHALRDGQSIENVEIPARLYKPASDTTFDDDKDFLYRLLPDEVLQILFDGSDNAPTVDDVMDGTYAAEYRKKLVTILENRHVLEKCLEICGPDGLFDECNDKWFVPVYHTFFILMENEKRLLRYYQQICDTHNQPQIGMTMFMLHSLLGERHFHRLVQSQTKAISLFAL